MALALGIDRQQHAVAGQVVDEEVAAAAEEAQRAQGFDDQPADLAFGAAALFLLVERCGDLHGVVDLLADVALEHRLAALAQQIELVVQGGQRCREHGLLLAAPRGLEGGAVLAEAAGLLQGEVAAQGQGQHEYQPQHAEQLQAQEVAFSHRHAPHFPCSRWGRVPG
ncbi:hypothetical protein D3C78_1205490 [compost metagenome]